MDLAMSYHFSIWNLLQYPLLIFTFNSLIFTLLLNGRTQLDPLRISSISFKLVLLIERVNETSQHDVAESQILAIISKEILKDSTEGLRIVAHS